MKIQEICYSITDGSHNPPQGVNESEYLMLSSKNVFDDDITFKDPRYLCKEDYDMENRRTNIQAGDVLLTIVGTVGRCAVVPERAPKFTLQRSVAVLHPREEICSSRFLMYALQGKRSYIEGRAKGVAQKGIYLGEVANIEVPLPEKSTQATIIKHLDKIASIIQKRKQQLSALDDFIKARFVELFGDPETNPKGWKKAQLKDHATTLVGYPFPSEGYTPRGIDIVGGYNLMQGYIQWKDSKHWQGYEGYEQYLLRENDIVMAMDRPWVNGGFKIARVDGTHLPALLIQRTACIRSIDVDQTFLYYMLDSNRFAEHCNITGSLVPHISNKDINSFEIIIPPIHEQVKFAAFVAQIDKSKSVIQKSLDETQLLFDSLMQRYFG